MTKNKHMNTLAPEQITPGMLYILDGVLVKCEAMTPACDDDPILPGVDHNAWASFTDGENLRELWYGLTEYYANVGWHAADGEAPSDEPGATILRYDPSLRDVILDARAVKPCRRLIDNTVYDPDAEIQDAQAGEIAGLRNFYCKEQGLSVFDPLYDDDPAKVKSEIVVPDYAWDEVCEWLRKWTTHCAFHPEAVDRNGKVALVF